MFGFSMRIIKDFVQEHMFPKNILQKFIYRFRKLSG